MKTKEFNRRYNALVALEKSLMLEKGAEYAQNDDRFSNFKNAVSLQVPGVTPEGAAWNMMSKHLEATMKGLRSLAEGNAPSQRFWDEKLGDIIIYTRLILLMTEERTAQATAHASWDEAPK